MCFIAESISFAGIVKLDVVIVMAITRHRRQEFIAFFYMADAH
jgi:hypothetical protein